MYRIMINLMADSGTDSDSGGAETRRKSAGPGGLIVPDIGNKIVLDEMAISASQIDSVGGPGLLVVVSNTIDHVLFDDVSACGTDHSNTDAGSLRTDGRGNVTLDINRIAPDHPDSGSSCAGSLCC